MSSVILQFTEPVLIICLRYMTAHRQFWGKATFLAALRSADES